MPDFDVTISLPNGAVESRTISAGSEKEAALSLLTQGLTPVQIRERRHGWLDRLNQPLDSTSRLRLMDLAVFAEQLSEMLKAGVTVEQALALIARDSSRKKTAALATRLVTKVRAGDSLSQAMAVEQAIPDFFRGLIRGSERGGKLAEGLAYLAEYLMQSEETRGKVIATLTYPAIVVATAIFAFFFVLVVVIPELAPLFAGEEHKLPFLTRIVLWLSELVTDRSWVLALVMIGGPATFWVGVRRVKSFADRVTRFVARIPIVDMLVRLDVAKTFRVLGALLASGVEVSEAVSLARESATSRRLKQGLLAASRQLREGSVFTGAMQAIDVVPESLISLISVGERTGDLGTATIRAAHLLELETRRRVDQLISLLSPVAVLLLGLMIAFLISGVMLGILSANQLVLR